jgi:hypothetical protein
LRFHQKEKGTIVVSITQRHVRLFGLASILLAGLLSSGAQAVPSFARQTGMPCAACHTAFPELTAFGRQFKLNGYTMQATPQLEDGDAKAPSLSMSTIPPFSVMLQVSYTDTKGANNVQPGTRENLQFPEQFSLFYAGEISPHLGAMLQVTHSDNSSGFSMDNSEIRYANHVTLGDSKDLLLGLVANNNPGMSDVYQTTPVWGYPFQSPLSYEAPLSWGLGGSVGGGGAYVMFDNSWYAEFDLYKTMGSGGQDTPLTDPFTALGTAGVAGWAPYWRLAYQTNFGDNFLEVGTFGMNTRLYATATGTSGPTDNFRDLAIDAQYERPFGNDSIVVRGVLAKETIGLDAYRASVDATQQDTSFRTLNLNGTYHFGSSETLSLGYVHTSGGASNVGALPPGAGTGTDAKIVEGAYYPWQNVRLSLQYVAYSKFMGTTSSASDNNTLYLLGWFMF